MAVTDESIGIIIMGVCEREREIDEHGSDEHPHRVMEVFSVYGKVFELLHCIRMSPYPPPLSLRTEYMTLCAPALEPALRQHQAPANTHS